MVILGYVLKGLAAVLDSVLWMLNILVIARAIISWVNPDPYNPIVRFLAAVTDPLLRPIRKRVPLVGPGLDLSPIILLLIILFLQQVLVGLLYKYAIEFGAV